MRSDTEGMRELSIRRVELAIQEQRSVGVRLDIDRENDRRRAAEQQQQEQQEPAWDAALERQKLRIDEAKSHIEEQKLRLQIAQLQREPASSPLAASAPQVPAGDGQYRAMAAALSLKNAQVRAGITRDALADAALVQVGAVDYDTAIKDELRRQAGLQKELAKAKTFDVRARAEDATHKIQSGFSLNAVIRKALEDAIDAGHAAASHPEVTVRSAPTTDQNPPSLKQWRPIAEMDRHGNWL